MSATLVTAYCQEFGVASRAASFLVLENEAEYKRLNLEEETRQDAQGRPGPLPRRRVEGAGEAASAKAAVRPACST